MSERTEAMKLSKFKKGAARNVTALVVILVVAVAGTAALIRSHAATLGYLGFYNLTSVANNDGVSVFASQDNLAGIGAQYVADIVPGKQLVYSNFPGKVVFNSVCYDVRVYNSPKSVTQVTSADVSFAGYGTSKTFNLPTDANYHEVCVGSGRGAQPAYSVWNQSTAAYVLVYAATVHY